MQQLSAWHADVVVLRLDMDNLGRLETLQQCARHIRDGRVHALFPDLALGTWSADKTRCVLRSRAALWGLPHNDLRHQKQVSWDNNLLRATLIMFAACVRTHCACVARFPAVPAQTQSVSVWALPYLAWIKELPECHQIHIQQGILGET